MKEVLTADLKAGKVGWPAMAKLLTSPMLRLLSDPELQKTIYMHVETAMSKWPSLKNKLLLVDCLYKYVVQEKSARLQNELERRMLEIEGERMVQYIVRAMAGESVHTAVSECLQIASNSHDIFLPANGRSEAYEAVARSIVTDSKAREIILRPDLLHDIPDTVNADAKFYDALLGNIRDAVKSQCKTMKEAVQFYDFAVNKRSSLSMQWQHIAEYVFCALFRQWNPTVMMDVLPHDKSVVDVFFSGGLLKSEFIDNAGHSVAACRTHMKHLVD